MRRSLLVTIALAFALLVGGCGGPSAAELKAQCFAKISLVQTEMKLFNADTGMDAPFQDVLKKTNAVCPSGGKYSYDAATGVVTCSVHGHP